MQGQPQLYTSISQSIRKIVREERLAGFYRGVLPPLTSLTILNTVNFSSYAYFKEVLKAETDSLGHTRAFEAKVRTSLRDFALRLLLVACHFATSVH
jgi:hypothetical protein